MTEQQVKAGYVYCLYNKMYTSYGDDVYKLGHTINPSKRICDYMTSYIDEPEYKYVSERQFENSLWAERILFFLLRQYRIKKNREFFKCDLGDIINTIKRIEQIPEQKIEKMYKLILSDFCSDRVFENVEETSHYLDCLVSPDLFFEKFMFKPNNPQIYKKFGYIKPVENDWNIIQEKLNNQSEEEAIEQP